MKPHKLYMLVIITPLVIARTPQVRKEPSYPITITWDRDSPTFPKYVGDFTRGKTHIFEKGAKNIAIEYNISDPGREVGVMIYLKTVQGFEPIITLEESLEEEKETISKVHKNAKLESEEKVELIKTGRKIRGLVASYIINGIYKDRRQDIYSQVYLFEGIGKIIKIRVSYPWLHHESIKPKVDHLIATIDWTGNPN